MGLTTWWITRLQIAVRHILQRAAAVDGYLRRRRLALNGDERSGLGAVFDLETPGLVLEEEVQHAEFLCGTAASSGSDGLSSTLLVNRLAVRKLEALFEALHDVHTSVVVCVDEALHECAEARDAGL